jgi:alkanesulfonate monooxygenase SsuD/methylene tetrahydromethanopterin reductase-like flavin-dependent oxidoreductase (luciferase family)
MRYGLQLRTLDAFADPRETVRVAAAAEEAGWAALLVWDHLAWASYGVPSADPWVTLGACANATSRILLGTAVTPLPRRRPHVVAQQLASLSLASGGRVVFGAGLGGPRGEYERFGEDADERRRAAMLDEGLDVVAALLTGEPVDHHGEHYTAGASDPVLDRRRLAPCAPSRRPLGRLARQQLR